MRRGDWQTVIEDMGIPAGKPKTIAVDLTGKLLSASREVRIVTNLCVYWDEIFLSENGGAPEARMTPVDAELADLHFRGFSKPAIDPGRKQPEGFDYDTWMPVSMWNPTPGLYTRYGDVRPLVERSGRPPGDHGIGRRVALTVPGARFAGRSGRGGSATSCCWWTAGPRMAIPTPRFRNPSSRCRSTP